MKSHLASSTSPDTVSWRNSKTGSIFIQHLIEQFRNHACNSDLQELFRKVRLCSELQVCQQMQPCQRSETLLRAELGPGQAISWQAPWEEALCKRDLVWPGNSAGSLEASASCHHVRTHKPSVLAQPMASLVPPDTCLEMPLGMPPDSLHPSHGGKRAALISPCCLSHPRSNIPLENSLSSCHHKNGLRCSGSSTSSQATDLLPVVSLFTSHLCDSLSSVPQTRYPVSGEDRGEIPHRSWPPDLVLAQASQRTCVLVARAGQWPDSIPISQLAVAETRCSRNSFR